MKHEWERDELAIRSGSDQLQVWEAFLSCHNKECGGIANQIVGSMMEERNVAIP
jgi:hypothetical protein